MIGNVLLCFHGGRWLFYMLPKLEKQLVNSKNVYVNLLFNLCLMLILQDMLVYVKKIALSWPSWRNNLGLV